MNTIALLIMCIAPQPDGLLRDSVATLEIQHFYDDEARLIFTQLIGWNEDETVRFWRMAKSEQYIPKRDWANGGYSVAFGDGDALRKITAPSYRETWGQSDRELENRTILPPEHRHPLRQFGGGLGR